MMILGMGVQIFWVLSMMACSLVGIWPTFYGDKIKVGEFLEKSICGGNFLVDYYIFHAKYMAMNVVKVTNKLK